MLMLRDSIQGRTWKFGKNISTDNIAPSRLFHLRSNVNEFAKYVLVDAREDFASGVQKDDFVVADTNFGCGSSREIAPLIIRISGVGAVLAKSFGRIFYRNAINIGLLLIECDTDGINDGDELIVDIKNRIIKKVNDPDYKQEFNLSEKEVKIINEGGLLNYIEKYNTLDI